MSCGRQAHTALTKQPFGRFFLSLSRETRARPTHCTTLGCALRTKIGAVKNCAGTRRRKTRLGSAPESDGDSHRKAREMCVCRTANCTRHLRVETHSERKNEHGGKTCRVEPPRVASFHCFDFGAQARERRSNEASDRRVCVCVVCVCVFSPLLMVVCVCVCVCQKLESSKLLLRSQKRFPL